MRLVKCCGTTAVSLAVLFLGSASVMGQDTPCSKCGPGDHWTDSCAAGSDLVDDQGAVVGIDLDLDCIVDTSIVMRPCDASVFEVARSAPVGHDIATEIVDLCLTDGTVFLIAGAGLGQGGVLAPSLGSIVEDGIDPALADSTFGVMFEVDLGGGNYVYNHTPLVISSEIDCVPPLARYIHPTGCTPLFDDPIAGVLVANIVSAEHNLFPSIPAVSEWGLAALMLLVLSAGTVIMMRRRSVQEIA